MPRAKSPTIAAPAGVACDLLSPHSVRQRFEGSAHLIRLAVVAAAFVVLFLLLRRAVVPAGFGQYGHFRPAALKEIAAREPVFAGREACAGCHDEIVQAKSKGPHANVGCEACHGALGAHANDPSALKPTLPVAVHLCPTCHEADAAKPKSFPQVVSLTHSGGASCVDCHNAHQPKL